MRAPDAGSPRRRGVTWSRRRARPESWRADVGGAAIGRPLGRLEKIFPIDLLPNRPNLGPHSDRLTVERGGGRAVVFSTH